MRFWCYWEVLEEAICLVDAIGLNCVIRRAREDRALSNLLVAGGWRAQVHRVDYVWRVFCNSCTPTHSLVDRFTTWKAAERFLPSSSISSSIIHQSVILFLHSSFLLF